MRFHDLDLNHLVALDVLLTEKNVTRAAQRVHLSQSAVSVILAQLREYFHNELLVTSGRTMILTPLAQSLAQPVRNALLQIQHTIASKVGFDPATSKRTFSLAISDYISAVLMPQVLQAAARQAPGVTFKFLSIDGPLEDQLANGRIDFIIRPSAMSSAAHSREELFRDGYCCVACSENSLVRRSLSLEQYFEMGHIAISTGGRPGYFDRWLEADSGKVRRVEVVASTFEAACRYVVGTQRIATINTRLARLCATHMPIRIFRVPFPIPEIIEMIEWNRYQDDDPGHVWFRDLLKQISQSPPFSKKGRPLS